MKSPGKSCRGNAETCLTNAVARSKATKPIQAAAEELWIASRNLGHNDGT
jgi:hypothetical protein